MSPILMLFAATVALGIGIGLWSLFRTRESYDGDVEEMLEARALRDRADKNDR